MRRRYKILLGLLTLLVVLGGALAWRIHTWGRPVPVAYRRIAVTPPDRGAGRSVTYLRVRSGDTASSRYVTVDTDGDGTTDIVLWEGSLESFTRPRADDPEARWLVLCLDGVPFEEMAALWQEGYFREFFRPVPLVAPFPTASGVALSELFHTGKVQGYEDGYFDIRRNRLAGGALMTTTGKDVPYLNLLDYDLPGYFKGPAYILARKSYRADLGRLRTRFLASDGKIYLAHIASSDSLYHVLPRADVQPLLAEVDHLLREFYLQARGKLRITLFSDHGNSLAESHPVALREHLAAGGWQLSDRCGGPRKLVAPAYGLLGFLAIYCAGDHKEELAHHLARMKGVDFVVYQDPDGVVIENEQGQAHLSWNQDAPAFRYQPRRADPLRLSEILSTLEGDGKLAPDGWIKDTDLFRATINHHYPDPAHRLWQWATNHVVNRADVLASLRPGYHYGSPTFERLVTLLSAHGSLDRQQTLGFAMSTDGPLPGAIRGKDLLPENLARRKAPAHQQAQRESKR